MKLLLILPFLLVGCANKKASFKIAFSDDIKLDHDQVLICPYIEQYKVLRCMSVEEYNIRVNSGE